MNLSASPAPVASGMTVTATSSEYIIAIDPARRHLRFDISGVWNRRISALFTAEVVAAIEQLLAAGVAFGTVRTLIDVRGAAVMPQEVVAALHELTRLHGSASERIAMLIGGMLQKMQFQRTVASPDFQAFFDEAEAGAWLFAD